MNLKEIKEIIKLMNDNNLVEVELEREGSKVKLSKTVTGVAPMMMSQPMPQMAAPVAAPQAAAPAAEKPAAASSSAKEIKSPMVGTFYRAPSPDAPPFVDVGQMVEVGQVVCIVEAMKLMNEIKSEVKGKIVAVSVENAEPVEFGQPLFVVEPV